MVVSYQFISAFMKLEAAFAFCACLDATVFESSFAYYYYFFS